MNELYWITRICVIHDIAFVAIIASVIVFVLAVIGCSLSCNEREDEATLEAVRKSGKKMLCCIFAAFCVSVMVYAFCPSEKEALLIFGGGAVIDYVQSSDEAKKLPDSAIKALNKWLEEDDNDNNEQ